MKICVYAIAKNELKYLDRWLDSMSEADYITVLDTGSTDGTLEFLQKDPRVTRVEQKIIDPWRFDVARNESMKLVPEDADVLVCTDPDEYFEPGWAQVLRDNWTPKITRCHYTYAWSHNDLGEPQDVFIYDKIHTRDYHWIFPVHEVLYPNRMGEEGFVEEVLDAGTNIYLHHTQDKSKDRTSYFDLLKLSMEENPTESHSRMLLAREYLVKEDYDNALIEYKKCLDMPDINKPERRLVLLETIGRIGDIYRVQGDYNNAILYYNKFLELDKTHREPYFCLAELYNQIGLYGIAKGMVEDGLRNSVQHYDWVERRDNWIAKADDILSVSEFYLGNYDEAIKHAQIAVKHNPNDIRILRNYIAFLEAKYILNNKEEK